MTSGSQVGRTRLPSLGARGQGWVWLQTVLTVLVVVLGWVGPPWPDPVSLPMFVIGTVVFLAGTAQVGFGIWAVRGSFGVFPRPVDGAVLQSEGLLGRVRHPIYGGMMLAAAGWVLALSPWSTVPAVLLVLELDAKRRVEERWLVSAYPGYRAYAEQVRRCYLVVP